MFSDKKILLADEGSQLPEGLELKLINDVSRFTKDMLGTLNSNALIGLLSVFLILWLFLNQIVKNYRRTSVVLIRTKTHEIASTLNFI